MVYAIETRDLTRVFHSSPQVVALDRASIQVKEGELFGVLGPNGAGKTTLIKILCTLLLPTSGKAFVGGWDVEEEPQKIREIINMVSGGEVSGYGLLTVRENLWLFSQLYGIPGGEARERIKELLKVVGLEARGDTKVNRISSGERQKMNLCRGLVTDPKILFLDEPTLGL
ncbi:MAG: ABC transporter ATP-binding protein, partial [Candidatus Hydrothermarchaeota archaeon]